jgi:hypothetical protein
MLDSPARGSAHKHEGDIDLELTAIPYTIKLDLECDGYCHGSLVRLPDGVEASFNHTEGLLVLLEGIGGRRWWQENQTQIEARVMTLATARS